MIKYASFFGGAMNDTMTIEYTESVRIGALLAEKGYSIKNGGYHGLMEAISLGSYGEVIGYTCETFPSTKGNNFLTQTVVCKDIYDRLRCLIEDSEIFVVQKGGVGTLTELFLVLDTVRKLKTKPRIFLIGNMYKTLFNEIDSLLNPNDYNLCHCANFEEFKNML